MAKQIDQLWGHAFITDLSARIHIEPREFVAMCQLSASVATARIVSAPCQRWIKAWASAMEEILSGQTFEVFARKFSDRHAALERLANEACANLIAEVGKKTICEYLAAIYVTRELAHAPRDVESN